MSNFLLEKNDIPLDIEIHSDPFCILPAAISKRRAFKKNKVLQEEQMDNEGGAAKCLLCNPELLDGKPPLLNHMEGKVISFPNAAPFLPGGSKSLISMA